MHARFGPCARTSPAQHSSRVAHKNVCLLVSCCHQVQRKHRPCVCVYNNTLMHFFTRSTTTNISAFFSDTGATHTYVMMCVCVLLSGGEAKQQCCCVRAFFVCFIFSSVSDVCTKLFRHFVLLLSSVCPPMIIVRICGRVIKLYFCLVSQTTKSYLLSIIRVFPLEFTLN